VTIGKAVPQEVLVYGPDPDDRGPDE
jgi:hypothetical protein